MAAEWRAMVLTRAATLLFKAFVFGNAINKIDLAINKLEEQHSALHAYRLGLADGYVFRVPVALLEEARREIMRCTTQRCVADDALLVSLPVLGLGLGLSDETAQRWNSHSSDALRNADEAKSRLLKGASFANAAIGAIDVAAALPFPMDVTRRTRWLEAAEQLQGKAIHEVREARDHMQEMRNALFQEPQELFLDAWNIRRLA